MNGEKELSELSHQHIKKAINGGYVGISAISLWEISMLHKRERIHLDQSCEHWITKSLEAPGIMLCPLTPAISVESVLLPGECHSDPADRLIIATARSLGVPLMTRDKRIIDYAQQGYVKCLKAKT